METSLITSINTQEFLATFATVVALLPGYLRNCFLRFSPFACTSLMPKQNQRLLFAMSGGHGELIMTKIF